MGAQVWIQTQGVLITLVWSGLLSAVLFYAVHLTIGFRVKEEEEREGLDLISHGERAYNM